MIRKICLTSFTFLAFALVTVGCSDGNRGSATSSRGVVGQLTGEPDDQVSPDLQAQVAEALTRGDTDEPVDTF